MHSQDYLKHLRAPTKTKTKKIIYISGPMTGIKDFNTPAFNAAEKTIRSLGYDVLNPAKNTKPTGDTWENYMRKAIIQVCKSDIICFLPGWSSSKGAWFELKVAGIIGLKIVAITAIEKYNKDGVI